MNLYFKCPSESKSRTDTIRYNRFAVFRRHDIGLLLDTLLVWFEHAVGSAGHAIGRFAISFVSASFDFQPRFLLKLWRQTFDDTILLILVLAFVQSLERTILLLK